MEKEDNRTRKVLIPEFMKSFQCIGPDCPENCCEINWLIGIDKENYRKLRQVQNEELTPLIKKYIKRNRSNPSQQNYAKLKFSDQSSCPFLSPEKYCRIQQELGEDYLNNVCNVYPRESNIINGQWEMTASMSCPEVARLALGNPEPMAFTYREEPVDKRHLIKSRIDLHK